MTSFIGRKQEMRKILDLLFWSARLDTVTGFPGIGKTRLALQLAIDMATSSSESGSTFPDSVYFDPLANTSDAQPVGSAIARTIGVR